jgi:hypothetical protein
MIDVEQTIISQYGNSATITRLVRNMNTYLDPRADFDAFYNFVWNVETAQGFGLDIWGRIVNISRNLLIPEEINYFGFSEAMPGAYPFDEGTFYDADSVATQTYRLADDAYRKLILIKALANISSTYAPSINQLLQNLFFDRGRCYILDSGNMQIEYVFEFILTPYEFAIMTQSGVLPRPAGVSIMLFATDIPAFGFSEAGTGSAAPFDQAPFVTEGSLNAING